MAMYAALNTSANNHLAAGLGLNMQPMNISIRINVHGQIMLVHDKPFDHIPLWIRYKNGARRVEILFDNGTTHPIETQINDSVNSHLVKSNKVMVIRTENNLPVESWDTILINDTYQ